ncbi:unnamed protein product, partial [marine sediment metagenome]
KDLKEKLINFDGADYLSKAGYDTDDNGIVEFSAQTATNGKNTSGVIIANLKLVHITGANPIEEVLEIELADASSGKPANGITLESVAIGGVGRVLLKGFAVPISLPGGAVGEIVYLDGLGSMQLLPPTSGLVQTVGVIFAIDAGNALVGFSPQDLDDRSDYLRDWREFTHYEKDVQFVIDLSTIPSIPSNAKVIGRVKIEDYTSSNSLLQDFDDDKIEGVGGDMFSLTYDPNGKRN